MSNCHPQDVLVTSASSGIGQAVAQHLHAQGLANVSVERSADPPAPNPLNGKFRHVWSEIRDTETHFEEYRAEYVLT